MRMCSTVQLNASTATNNVCIYVCKYVCYVLQLTCDLLQDLLAGTFAGTCQLVVGHPFDTGMWEARPVHGGHKF
jgi:hypothetical protein